MTPLFPRCTGLAILLCVPLCATQNTIQLSEYIQHHDMYAEESALPDNDYGQPYTIEIKYTHQNQNFHFTQDIHPDANQVEKFRYKAKNPSKVSYAIFLDDYLAQLQDMQQRVAKETIFNMSNTEVTNYFALYQLGQTASKLEALHHTLCQVETSHNEAKQGSNHDNIQQQALHDTLCQGQVETSHNEAAQVSNRDIQQQVNTRFQLLEQRKQMDRHAMIAFYKCHHVYQRHTYFRTRNIISLSSNLSTLSYLALYFRQDLNHQHLNIAAALLWTVAGFGTLLVCIYFTKSIHLNNKAATWVHRVTSMDYGLINTLNLLQSLLKEPLLNLTGIAVLPWTLYEMYTMLSADFDPMHQKITNLLKQDENVILALKQANKEAAAFAEQLGDVLDELYDCPQPVSDIIASYLKGRFAMETYSTSIKHNHYHYDALIPPTAPYQPDASLITPKRLQQVCIIMLIGKMLWTCTYFGLSIFGLAKGDSS